jgi:Ca2+-binding RTX toxin-like protein
MTRLPLHRAARAVIALTALAGGALALPGGASASNVVADTDFAQFNAAAGETNNVTVSRVPGAISFSDPGAPVTPGLGCAAVNANQVTCTVPREGIQVNLANMNDRAVFDGSVTGMSFLQLQGGDGADSLTIMPRTLSNASMAGDSFSDVPGPGDGPDVLQDGPSDSFLLGGGGNDVVSGGDGFDQMAGSAVPDGADSFSGGGDNDSYGISSTTFTPLQVSLNGAADDGFGCPGPGCEGDNVMPDVESVSGTGGNDVLIGNGANNSLFGSDGADTLRGRGGADTLFSGLGDDDLRGEAGGDQLLGGDGTDRVDGGPGDDVFDSGVLDDEPDTIIGGKGLDLMDYSLANSPVHVDLDGKADDGVSGENDNVRRDVEDLIGSEFDDVLAGSPAANDLQGGDGADTLLGGKGLDGLIGGDGGDRINGGAGHDLLDGGAGPDRLRSRDGTRDNVLCGSSLDRVKADRADRLTADCDKVGRR